LQLKNADQILAEDKHLPLYEVRVSSSSLVSSFMPAGRMPLGAASATSSVLAPSARERIT
jgi:hypothetical protein